MDHQRIVIIGDVVLALAWVVSFVVSTLRWTPERGRAAARAWAEARQVACDDVWLEPVQRQLRTNSQADMVAMFFLFYALTLSPVSVKVLAAMFVCLSYVVVIARGLGISRQILPPGPRVARARQVTAADYLPGRTRQIAWASAVCGLIACTALGIDYDNRLVAASGVLLLIPPVMLEWAGARLARMPEPADSAAHLYLQDAFRSDLLRFASFRSALAAGTLTGYVGLATITEAQAWVPIALVALTALLYVGLIREVGDLREDPVGYMRTRLWGEVRAS